MCVNGFIRVLLFFFFFCFFRLLRAVFSCVILSIVVKSYRLAALMAPPLRPPEGLDEMPDALDPLGLRARIPPDDSDDGIVEPLRGSVLDEPGRLRAAESGLWKLGVRRTPVVGVFCAEPPSIDASKN